MAVVAAIRMSLSADTMKDNHVLVFVTAIQEYIFIQVRCAGKKYYDLVVKK